MAQRAVAICAIAPWADIHDLAQSVHRKSVAVFFPSRALLRNTLPGSERRQISFASLYQPAGDALHHREGAKNTVAFFKMSLSSRSNRFSFRSSVISGSRSDWAVGFSGLRRSSWIQRLSVENPTPKSAATCLRLSQLVSATRTASARNSGVCDDAILSLLCGKIPSQRSGTIPRQVQSEPASWIKLIISLICPGFAITHASTPESAWSILFSETCWRIL